MKFIIKEIEVELLVGTSNQTNENDLLVSEYIKTHKQNVKDSIIKNSKKRIKEIA